MRHRVGSFIRFPFLGFCVVPLAGVLALAGCGTLSQEKEEQIGHAVQREVRQSHQLMRDRIIVNYVRQMGDDLVAASEPTDFEIRFYVVEDEDINAFVIPGGAIYVTTGTILAAENAAQLAGVIAHEIGHVTERHFAENYRADRNTGLAVNVVGLAAAVLTGSPLIANSANLASSVAAAAYTTSYGREAEREADRRAVEALVRAGYDPSQYIRFFEILQAQHSSAFYVPQFLRSHPVEVERMELARSQILEMETSPGLRTDDGGKLEIIQRRVELVVGTDSDS